MLGKIPLLWGAVRTGAMQLAAGIGVTVLSGLLVQLLALRSLSNGAYATFVLALSVGNVANAIAAAIQPVVAKRVLTGRTAFLPAPIHTVLSVLTVGCLLATVVIGRGIGALLAFAIVLQIPLHAAVAVGQGSLQAQCAFARLASGIAIWSVARVAVVVAAFATARGSVTMFVLALPIALFVELVVLVLLGAYQQLSWRFASAGRQLLGHYALWVIFGWIINADAIYARLLLPLADAGAYATAATLGRQPIYLAAPLVLVLLPVTMGSDDRDQRHRLAAILVLSVALLAGTVLVLGIWPERIVVFLTHAPERADGALLRGYAIAGPLAATATLLLAFTFALHCTPRLRDFAVISVIYTLVAIVVIRTPRALLLLHIGALFAVVVSCLRVAMRATRPLERERTQ